MSYLAPIAIGLAAGIGMVVLFSIMMPTFSSLPRINVDCYQHFKLTDRDQAILIVTSLGKPITKPQLPSVTSDYLKKYPFLVDAMNEANMCRLQAIEINKSGSALFRPPVELSYTALLPREQVMELVNDPEFQFQGQILEGGGQPIQFYATLLYVEGKFNYRLTVNTLA